ncbi:hypothetical protein TNCV_3938211 [Trichonephila clavipes]|nr:hypothetical protein TNCV_3938211 [Trichonephila clavipes]
MFAPTDKEGDDDCHKINASSANGNVEMGSAIIDGKYWSRPGFPPRLPLILFVLQLLPQKEVVNSLMRIFFAPFRILLQHN